MSTWSLIVSHLAEQLVILEQQATFVRLERDGVVVKIDRVEVRGEPRAVMMIVVGKLAGVPPLRLLGANACFGAGSLFAQNGMVALRCVVALDETLTPAALDRRLDEIIAEARCARGLLAMRGTSEVASMWVS